MNKNKAIAKDAALTGLSTLRPEDMPTKAHRKRWSDDYRNAQDGALKLVKVVNNLSSASVASDSPNQSNETRAVLSKNVARSLRHKLNMVWLRDHKGDGWHDGKSEECNHEVAYVYNAIAETYASKNYAGALWLDRELKLKQAYERAVETISMSDQWPTRPMLYRLFDEAACYATNPLSATSD